MNSKKDRNIGLWIYLTGGVIYYACLIYTLVYHNTYTGLATIFIMCSTMLFLYIDEVRPSWFTGVFPSFEIPVDEKNHEPVVVILFYGFFHYIYVTLASTLMFLAHLIAIKRGK